jgi:large subunit ribosomal protein L10
MSKKIKELELTALRKTFKGVVNYVVVEPLKVDSATDAEFRRNLRTKKVGCKMIKNALMQKILEENGVKAGALSGVNLLCWGSDSCKGLATAVGDAVKDSKKDPKAPDKFKVRGGIAEGEPVDFEVMKKIPTREEAIGSVLSAILAPGANLAAAIMGPANDLAGIVKAVEAKAPAAAPEPPAA